MRKVSATIFIAFFVLPMALAFAQTKSKMETNRRMLAFLERQHYELVRRSEMNSTPTLRQKLEKTRSLITLLKDEREKLYGVLKSNDQAQEFLKDTLAKKSLYKLQQNVRHSQRDTYLLHTKALKLTEEKKYGEAIQTYREILLMDPYDDQAYLIMGHLYLLTFRVREAEEAFFNAVDIDPDNRNSIVPFYQNLALQEPSDFHYTCLGFAYLILGDESKAKDAFQEAMTINPMNQRANNALLQLGKI